MQWQPWPLLEVEAVAVSRGAMSLCLGMMERTGLRAAPKPLLSQTVLSGFYGIARITQEGPYSAVQLGPLQELHRATKARLDSWANPAGQGCD